MPAPKNKVLHALWLTKPSNAIRVVVDELTTCNGNVTEAAEKLNVSLSTLKYWIEDYPELQRSLDRIRRELASEDVYEDNWGVETPKRRRRSPL